MDSKCLNSSLPHARTHWSDACRGWTNTRKWRVLLSLALAALAIIFTAHIRAFTWGLRDVNLKSQSSKAHCSCYYAGHRSDGGAKTGIFTGLFQELHRMQQPILTSEITHSHTHLWILFPIQILSKKWGIIFIINHLQMWCCLSNFWNHTAFYWCLCCFGKSAVHISTHTKKNMNIDSPNHRRQGRAISAAANSTAIFWQRVFTTGKQKPERRQSSNSALQIVTRSHKGPSLPQEGREKNTRAGFTVEAAGAADLHAGAETSVRQT